MKNIKRNEKLSILKGNPLEGTYLKQGNIGNLLIEAANNKDNKGIVFVDENYEEKFLSYKEILKKALTALGYIKARGVKRGDYIILIVNNNVDFVINFWACVLGGIIAVPLPHAQELKIGNSSLDKILSIWNSLNKPIIIVDEVKKKQYESFAKEEGLSINLIGTKDILASKVIGNIELSETKEAAFIQFSSGSTNSPKGIILSHENILTNIESMTKRLKINSKDTIMNWMPFTHDMGLIGFHILEIATVSKIVQLNTISFIKNPTIWLELITKHKATVTCCPNFGYKLLLPRLKEENINKYKLESIRVIINGAEPISENLVREFLSKLSVCGLKEATMNLAYGMAEATLAITISPINSKAIFHCIDGEKASKDSKAELKTSKEGKNLIVADLGPILDGMELRVVDDKNNILKEGHIGEVQIKGKNITKGYINNKASNEKMFVDGWLKTGDMGFVINNRLSLTGRLKDIIFVNGQNFYAHDIEQRIETINGVDPGKIAVCGYHDEDSNKEKVVLFSNLLVKDEIYGEIFSFVSSSLGFNFDKVVKVKEIPRTNSGKVQRFVLLKDFLLNKFKEDTYEAKEFLSLKTETKTEGAYIEKIKNIWSKVLEIPTEEIKEEVPFLALGGNSLKAIQMLSYLEEELKIELSHDILISCTTILEMDRYISKKVNQASEDKQDKISFDKGEPDDIAVIAMSTYMPDANNIEEFWSNIEAGKSSIKKVPRSRFKIEEYYEKNLKLGKTYSDRGAFIDNPYDFAASFFNISKEEAVVMDPQQRILLELVYRAIEDGGYTKNEVNGKNIGVFIGAGTNNYLEYHLNTLKIEELKTFNSLHMLTEEQRQKFLEEWKGKFGTIQSHTNVLVDNINNMLAARISHEYNFKGPSLAVDTACSSALVTIHMACEAIKSKECDMAIAGGVNLLLTPTPYIYFSNAGALSSSGESKVFDKEADGFVPGEGAGVVILKALNKALTDGDEILAVIKGSEVNNDGRSIGVMAPNPDGQREVIENLYNKRKLNPKYIQYVEAHGTGTKIGDPSEVRALKEAYSSWQSESGTIAIGSVKANIGHLLNAAGIASFIKVVLALKNKKIPPSINVTEQNPLIKFEDTPFYLPSKAVYWENREGKKRMAAINSFGFGGTNCHMVLEEAPLYKVLENNKALSTNVLCIGAQQTEELENKILNLKDFLEKNPKTALGDVCYTENIKSATFKKREYIVAESTLDLVKKLDMLKPLENRKAANKIAFMFTGQGCQYINMARELYEEIPEFKAELDKCSEAFYPYISQNITDLLYGKACNEEILKATSITQPVVFSIDYSLGKLLMTYGIKPYCLVGHSIGEWVAAAIAKVVTLKEAAKLVSIRGKLMGELASSGAMAAVFTSREKLLDILKAENIDKLWIAAYNGSHQVISGSESSVSLFIDKLSKKGIVAKKLKVSEAFHTPLMEPMLEKFKLELDKVQFKTPEIKIVSNVTGEFIKEPIDSNYWLEHILSPVKFEQSINFIKSKGVEVFVECGPDKILTAMAMSVLQGEKLNVIKLLDRKKYCLEIFFEAIGALHVLTGKIDWKKVYAQYGYKRIHLPLYPFKKENFAPDFGRDLTDEKVPAEWFYKWSWQEDKEFKEKNLKPEAVLIFSDDQGISKELSKSLKGKVDTIYFVTEGSNFKCNENNCFELDYRNKEAYKELFSEIKKPIGTIIYLKTLNKLKPMEEAYDFYSIFSIGQAIKNMTEKNIEFYVITEGAFKIRKEESIGSPYLSLSTKITEALDEELEDVNCKVIDIKAEEYRSPKETAAEIFKQLTIEFNEEHVAVIRNGEVYQRKLEALYEGEEEIIELNDGDTIVITGGMGPIAGEIAKELAKKAKVNLVLLGRSKAPLREEKLKLIRDLEKLQSKVQYISVDVTNYIELEACIKKVKDKFGKIHGVIHAAGVIDYSELNLLNKKLEDIDKVLAPKVKGTINIDLLTREEPLKFFAMLSSVSASKKTYSKAIGDYAAANAFLNGYSSYRISQGANGKTVAINYSLWKEKGMASGFGKGAEIAAKAQGLLPLDSTRAVAAFFKALALKNIENVHVIDFYVKEKENPVQEKSISYVQTEESKDIIYEIIAEVLKIKKEELDIDENFMELGLDSIGAVKIMSNLSESFNKELYPTLIFEYQTPRSLAKYIEENYFVNNPQNEVSNLKVDETTKEAVKDIAIIGISLRIPGADNLDEYWNILNDGKVVIKDVCDKRWSSRDEYSAEKNSSYKTYSKTGGFINGLYSFDPLFFGISPKEAEVMDPQQRIFLQVAYEALQSSGYAGKYKTNEIGVYVGCEQNGYMEHFSNYRNFKIIEEKLSSSSYFKEAPFEVKQNIMDTIVEVLKPSELVADAVAGNGLNEVASRVSHCLNLMGPSLTVNTACSSSLVALHLACENLRVNPNQVAIVGGVNLNTNSIPFISMSKLNAISPSGKCRPFDKSADGMVLSEGVSAIVIKPLSKALEAGDNIYAVIKGSAINNDGHSQGITAPNPKGQAMAIEMAYKNAGINPETVDYIEAHGTGTPLGDPIEVKGMTDAFRKFTNKNGFCNISSVKGSIGHMLAASGLVSLIKVILAMKHNTIPKVVNFEEANVNINFENTPFIVAKKNLKWNRASGIPLRAGVNAFGFGGTNAHIVIEEPPVKANRESEKTKIQLLQITAASEKSLKQVAKNLWTYTLNNEEHKLKDICATMNESQKQHSYKAAIVASCKEEFLKKLEAVANGEALKETYFGRVNPKRETDCHLIFDGSMEADENTIEALKIRFKAFDKAYTQCKSLSKGISLSTKLESFFLEYSIGKLLRSLDINLESIIVKGLGIVSGAALTGKISISQGISIILEENISMDLKKEEEIKCPLVTSNGILNCIKEKEILYILDSIYEDKLYANLKDIVKKNSVILYLGSKEKIKEELLNVEVEAELINEHKSYILEEDLLLNLSKLYVHNVQYNPKNIYVQLACNKIALPTYPFDLQNYEVKVPRKVLQVSNIKKIDNYLKLDNEEKKEIANKLNCDFKIN